MTLEELKIQLDLNEPIDVLRSVAKENHDNDWFIVCDDGDCHLFDNDGNEIDIRGIRILDEYVIPKDIKKINVPNSIIRIGYSAFAYRRNLISITISDSVKSIAHYSFEWCENLTSIVIPDSIEHIGYNAFYKCKNLKSLTFKGKTIDQVKSMEHYPWGIYDKFIIKCTS